MKNSWIFFRKDGYNVKNYGEWLIPRYGDRDYDDIVVSARYLDDNGYILASDLPNTNGARPVFYLSSDVKIKEGTDGTKENPYILDVQE